jgi:hypothetical protein
MKIEGCILTDEEAAFRRLLTFPEEDRHRYTTAPWTGGFRWFRSSNVLDLEVYRRRRRIVSQEGPAP